MVVVGGSSSFKKALNSWWQMKWSEKFRQNVMSKAGAAVSSDRKQQTMIHNNVNYPADECFISIIFAPSVDFPS